MLLRRTLFLQIHRPRQRPITHHTRLLLLTSDDISPPLTIHNPFADLLLRLASISASSIVQVQVLCPCVTCTGLINHARTLGI